MQAHISHLIFCTYNIFIEESEYRKCHVHVRQVPTCSIFNWSLGAVRQIVIRVGSSVLIHFETGLHTYMYMFVRV